MQFAFYIASGIAAFIGLRLIGSWRKEQNALRQILIKLNGQVKVKEQEDIVRIKKFLNANIRCDRTKQKARRPILRHTATEILKANYGFCGENARVANLLFALSGVQSNRLYLVMQRGWEHVALEHEWAGNWWFFDGHVEEYLPFANDMVTKIRSNDIGAFPNIYGANPYVSFSRIKALRGIPVLQRLSMIRLPKAIIVFAESPDLIKATVALLLSILLLLLSINFNG